MNLSLRKIGIIAILVLAVIASTVFLANKWRNDVYFTKLTVEGNYTIDRNEILAVARLKDDSSVNIEELNIDLIQDRIANHPEVKKVFVSKEPPAELKIQIIEKNPIAILNSGSEAKLIDDELEIFPFSNYEKMLDLPVISGLKVRPTKIDPDKLDEEDLRIAAFIITNARKEGKSLLYQISEVNMSDSEKVVVYSNDGAVPFYFPRLKYKSIADKEYQDLIKSKLDVYQEFCDKILGNQKNILYVDLRFSNQVVVNHKRNIITEGEEKSPEEKNESQKEKI
jgi:cell division septal protein FtsQ